MAELVRRGLEYVLSTSPHWADKANGWSLPEPRALGGGDPFLDPDWREKVHVTHLRVAEDRADYDSDGRGK